ncbi:hypothetical protein ACWEQL_13510, partial [Kitasatospora sp. NPDC004240]
MTALLAVLGAALLTALFRKFFPSGDAADADDGARDWARRSFDAAAYGLVPRDELEPARSGPPGPSYRRREIQAIADSAWQGDWRPAAAYVASARDDWDERWSRIQLLEHIATKGDEWLESWRSAEPGDCDAATLEARLMVHRAWEIRGSKYAHEVPEADMAEFRRLLPAAIEAARRASLLAPENPGPWVVMITAARGAQYEPDRFRPLWDELVARAPFHYDAHWQAMQYWCAKWFGSDEEMLDFAEQAVRKAPAGSPLAGIHLYALQELEKRNGAGALPKDRAARDLLTAVAASLATVPEDDEHLWQLRHRLAYHLGRVGLHAEALEQFRLLGPWCGSYPWTGEDDPALAFDLARGVAVRRSRTKPDPAAAAAGAARA